MASDESTFAQLIATFSRLSGRERTLVGLTVLAALLFLFVGGTLYVQSRLVKAERRLVERQDQLKQILALESQYKEAERERSRQREQLERNNVQLFSYLPKVAQKLGLTLNDLNERRTPLKDSGIDQISVDVNLRRMSLDKLDAFLEEVEGPESQGMVKVLKVKVKTRFDSPDLLDVTMKVATYKPSAG